ncbi:MAG: hypothetical protein MJZ15_05280 [Bacteroidales bacterium]|nr:hypothetical protein [Bacteroidales bacterium]
MANKKMESLTDEDYKIVPGVGFGKIKFGMSKEAVIEMLGQPDEIEEDANYGDDPNDKVTVLYYDMDGFSMSFDKEYKYKMTEISFDNDMFVLEGKVRVGMAKEEALKVLEAAGWDEPMEEDLADELDEENKGTTAYTYEEQNVTLWFDDETLGTIQVGPQWIDADTIKWPK